MRRRPGGLLGGVAARAHLRADEVRRRWRCAFGFSRRCALQQHETSGCGADQRQ